MNESNKQQLSENDNMLHDFINFVYGNSNTKGLSKLIDEIVEFDIKSLKKRDTNIKLTKLVLWHMVLLDILNLKKSDLDKSKPLTVAITDAVKLNSEDRLKFLSSKALNVIDVPNLLYDYSESIFEELADTSINSTKLSDESDEQENKLKLIRKIFCCFFEVSFCQMKKAANFEPYKNDAAFYRNYEDIVLNLHGRFYMRVPDPHREYVYADYQDMPSYLFATNKLQTFLSNYGTDFLYYFGWNCRLERPESRLSCEHLLLFLNEVEPIEERYKKDRESFIKLFCPCDSDQTLTESGEKMVIDLRNSIAVVFLISSILGFIEDENCFSQIRDVLIQRYELEEEYFKDLANNIEGMKDFVKCCHGKCGHPQHQGNSIIDETKNWFQDIAKRFAENGPIELMTNNNTTQIINNNGEFQSQVDSNNLSEPDFANLAEMLDYFISRDPVFCNLVQSFNLNGVWGLDFRKLSTLGDTYDINKSGEKITNYQVIDFLCKQIPIIYKNFPRSKVILFLKRVTLEFIKFVGHYLLIYPIIESIKFASLHNIISTIGAIFSCASIVLFASSLIFSWGLAACIASGIFFGACFLLNIYCSCDSGKKLYAEDAKTAKYLTDFDRLQAKLKEYLENHKAKLVQNPSTLEENKSIDKLQEDSKEINGNSPNIQVGNEGNERLDNK